MPIIIDNFHVNVSTPIDNRFVVGSSSFYSNKEDISYKYLGLRIWDLNDNTPYYWAGTVSGWLSENSVGVLIDNTAEAGYISKFTSGPTIIGKSLIYENNAIKQLGIGLTGSNINANYVGGSSVQYGLHVAGNVRTNSNFIGNGVYITDINANNINSGLLKIQYISPLQVNNPAIAPVNANTDYILFNRNNLVSWRETNTLTVLNSENTTNVNVVSETSTTPHFVTFVLPGASAVPIKYNSSKMQFKPDNGQLFLSNGSATEPVYSFLNSTSTGIYYNGDINFTFPSGKSFSIRPGTITIYDSNYTQIDFYKSPTDVQKLFVGQGNILKYRTNSWDPSDIVQVASDNVIWHSGNLYTLRNSGNLSIETGRLTNSQSTDANGALIKGVYTYNYYGSTIPISNVFTNTIAGNVGISQHTFYSVLSFGKGDEGSVQLASNWYGNNATPSGNVVADREILIRSLRDAYPDSWSPWVKIWNSGNSGYVPFGAIMMWSGSATLLPTGWRLCDGSAAVSIPAGSVPGQPSMTSITIPDLRERFVVGAGGDNEDVVSYDFNRFVINATLPFSNGTTTINKTINQVFVKVNESSLVNGNVLYTSAVGSSSVNPVTDSIYAIYYAQGNTAATSYFLVYNISTKNYRLYNNFIQINGVTLSPASSPSTINWFYDPPQGSLAELKQIGDLVTYRPNFTQLLWQISNTGYSVGDKGGFTNVRLHTSEIPAHSHDFMIRADGSGGGNYLTLADTSNSDEGGFDIYPGGDTTTGNLTIKNKGGDLPHENRPPYYALAFIIYTGI